MKNSDEQNARMESERALQQVIFAIMADNMELFKQFQDNPSFKKWLSDLVFNMTYEPQGKKQGTKKTIIIKAERAVIILRLSWKRFAKNSGTVNAFTVSE